MASSNTSVICADARTEGDAVFTGEAQSACVDLRALLGSREALLLGSLLVERGPARAYVQADRRGQKTAGATSRLDLRTQ
jgi:hypothetical protein